MNVDGVTCYHCGEPRLKSSSRCAVCWSSEVTVTQTLSIELPAMVDTMTVTIGFKDPVKP